MNQLQLFLLAISSNKNLYTNTYVNVYAQLYYHSSNRLHEYIIVFLVIHPRCYWRSLSIIQTFMRPTIVISPHRHLPSQQHFQLLLIKLKCNDYICSFCSFDWYTHIRSNVIPTQIKVRFIVQIKVMTSSFNPITLSHNIILKYLCTYARWLAAITCDAVCLDHASTTVWELAYKIDDSTILPACLILVT